MPATGEESAQDEVAGLLDRYAKDPLAFVREQFGAQPDVWQAIVLWLVRWAPRVALSACKGPGKSCVMAWIVWWFMATNVDAQVIVVSITADNLRDNLWKELSLWYGESDLLQGMFEVGSERITARDPRKRKTWWVSARSFPKQADATQQANTLAGFHGAHIMVVLDEVSDYPQGVVAAAEAIFANVTDAHLVVAGNPTRSDGPLYRIVTVDAELWEIVYINGDPDDPNRSPRIDIDWAREQIAKYGRDDPWIMTNILGRFPPRGSNQLIGINEVLDAMSRDVPLLHYRGEARVWGLDPSRYGDDEACLARRQGVLCRRIISWRNKNSTQLGDCVAKAILDAQEEGEGPDCVFVDVGGLGSGVYDRLCFLGFEDIVEPIDFGSNASDKDRYLNKRTEMWDQMAKWIKGRPACLPNDPVLQQELIAPTYSWPETSKKTRMALETKEQMRKRGVPSPNRGDAVCLTFAAPVMPHSRAHRALVAVESADRVETDYDPLARS